MQFIPAPNRVLVLLREKDRQAVFKEEIKRNDGSVVNLASIEYQEGFDEYYVKNMSIGEIVAVGEDVTELKVKDKVVINYLMDVGDNDELVGYIDGDRLLSVIAKTTYHEEDSYMGMNGMYLYHKGDIKDDSPILAVYKNNWIKPVYPYAIVDYETNISQQTESGIHSTKEEMFVTRKILSVHKDTNYKQGDMVVYPFYSTFYRIINNKIIEFVDTNDIILKK